MADPPLPTKKQVSVLSLEINTHATTTMRSLDIRKAHRNDYEVCVLQFYTCLRRQCCIIIIANKHFLPFECDNIKLLMLEVMANRIVFVLYCGFV